MGSTSYKTNEMARYENTSCKLKWNGNSLSISCKANEISGYENTSCKVKWNGTSSKYFM